ncbi:unnamed protein product [Kuraishia capsulata CBS 1993]|uniref:glycogenin glucosyltransferase n=1 Tax=Kuraishia capsulata CBS 1993 TaxID=1382522 RepID=W6MRS1_9ASCO|nr:uncharacterized protein KUCA_T00005045001 [Kuraishia capsulata CBS 1993]CDK29058.1 unnamed protein product [Kuraishia capsulata CBS 1993]
MSANAYATLLTSDSYLPGALVLGRRLALLSSAPCSLVVLVSDNVSKSSRQLLAEVYDSVVLVPRIISKDIPNLHLLGRPDLEDTLTKCHLWNLPFSKVVYLDADVVPVQSLDLLFEEELGPGDVLAAPDSGWPDYFNSGVLVLKPHAATYDELINEAAKEGSSFDGGDQGLFNTVFPDWNRLSFCYNVTQQASSQYEYLPALLANASKVRAFHFIGSQKPWESRAFETCGYPDSSRPFYAAWWDTFDTHYFGERAAAVFTASSGVDTELPEGLLTTTVDKTLGEAWNLSLDKHVNEWDREETSGYTPGVLELNPPKELVEAYEVNDDKVEPEKQFPWDAHKVPATRYFPEDR